MSFVCGTGILNVSSKRKKAIKDGTDRCIFEGPSSDTLIVRFNDEHQLLDGEIFSVPGKGAINNRFSEVLFSRLLDLGVDTHFIKTLNMREQVVQSIPSLPFFLQTRLAAFGEFAERFGIDEGASFVDHIVEFVHESEKFGHKTLSREHIVGLGWLDEEGIDALCSVNQRISDFLVGFFSAFDFHMARIELRYGCLFDGFFAPIFLLQDITFDRFDLIDLKTQKLHSFEKVETAQEIHDFYKMMVERCTFLRR